MSFVLNLVAWGCVHAGVLSRRYPYLPIGVGCMIVIWVGRGMLVQARSRAKAGA